MLDSDAGRYFGETERAEKKQKAQELLAEFEPLPEPPSNEESLFFSALEAIGRGEEPLSQGIERTTENLVRISYEHFPQGTEQVLAALSHIDSAIDTVVEFVDDRTGNTISAMWTQLDETSQARILGAGKVLSVLVPVAKVKALAELSRVPSRDARYVLRDIESHTDLPISKNQRTELVKHLRENDHTFAVTKADYDAGKKEYRKLRPQIIKDWEANTGKSWPKTDKGVPYQAHHIITERYGGPNTWWNIHPARFPDQHQAGIHRANGATSQVFPHNPVREQ